MKKIAAIFLAGACAIGGAVPCAAKSKKETPKPAEQTYQFRDKKVIPTTSVKDQNKSGTCWSFAGSSFVEDEIIRNGGDSLDLSEMWAVRNCYNDKAVRYVRLGKNHAKFGSGGTATDVIYTMRNYGLVPEEAYSGLQYGEPKHYHNEMQNGMAAYIDAVAVKPNKRLSTQWLSALNGIMDAYLGEKPETFTYKGKTYTPRSFADAQPINPDDYVMVTSFTHHPYYETFALELADNWRDAPYYNVPLDDMMAIVDNAVENGFPIAWSTDVSEPSFKWRKGYANFPKEFDAGTLDDTELSKWVTLSDDERANERFKSDGPVEEWVVTPEERQEMFDRKETTDDHGMEIVGFAEDQTGARFYKVKNSWDDNQVYGGFLYASAPYLRAKTLGVYLHKDAIPAQIRQKMGL